MALYTLAKDLNISPKEALELPMSLVVELLCVHTEIENYKAEALDKMKQK